MLWSFVIFLLCSSCSHDTASTHHKSYVISKSHKADAKEGTKKVEKLPDQSSSH